MSRPTSSMSTVSGSTSARVVVSGAGGGSRPRKNGICGCMPAVVSSVERSSARGISDADGRRRWPFSSKKERKPSRISADVRIGAHCRDALSRAQGGVGSRAPYPRRDAVAQALPLPVPPAHPRGGGRRPRRRSGEPGSAPATRRRPPRLRPTPTRAPAVPAVRVQLAAPERLRHRLLAAAPGRGCGGRCSPRRRSSWTRTRDSVLWELHPHERRHVASTTKIMTALLALRKLAPDDIVTVDQSRPARPARARRAARGRARPGVEALLLAAALLRERRRARARDRRRRRQVDVRPADERGGARARARRHALLARRAAWSTRTTTRAPGISPR